MDPKPWHPTAYNIQTPRLTLRTPTPADVEPFFKLLQTPQNFPHDPMEKDLTVEKLSEHVDRMVTAAASGKNGFLMFASRETGELVGFGGYNCFEMHAPSAFLGNREAVEGEEKEEEERMTDFGVVLDYKHWRKRYGIEILCALVEYARAELGCELFRVETGMENGPWRALMGAMGFGGSERPAKASYDGAVECLAWRFDGGMWEEAKKGMREAGKWPLGG
ncbi:hypothetical protein jhhlp_006825 [Lomentospora prolificans]|uniref:N-acetyltransferase domain-containing protein n=1 Tax=Lomentospora prolificans TaxID=41688 RepID=A0A2N3N2U2_9PEZI|nr:hypothetical protein jhhlp_006825 [Lomentospora prolificans]